MKYKRLNAYLNVFAKNVALPLAKFYPDIMDFLQKNDKKILIVTSPPRTGKDTVILRALMDFVTQGVVVYYTAPSYDMLIRLHENREEFGKRNIWIIFVEGREKIRTRICNRENCTWCTVKKVNKKFVKRVIRRKMRGKDFVIKPEDLRGKGCPFENILYAEKVLREENVPHIVATHLKVLEKHFDKLEVGGDSILIINEADSNCLLYTSPSPRDRG